MVIFTICTHFEWFMEFFYYLWKWKECYKY